MFPKNNPMLSYSPTGLLYLSCFEYLSLNSPGIVMFPSESTEIYNPYEINKIVKTKINTDKSLVTYTSIVTIGENESNILK